MDLKGIEEILDRQVSVDLLANADLPDHQEIFPLLLVQWVCKELQEKEVSLDLQVLKVHKDKEVSLARLDLLEFRVKMEHQENVALKEIEVIVEFLV